MGAYLDKSRKVMTRDELDKAITHIQMENKLLRECLENIHNQDGQYYGMEQDRAAIFRSQRCISLAAETLEGLKGDTRD
jgi:hypothetical protein